MIENKVPGTSSPIELARKFKSWGKQMKTTDRSLSCATLEDILCAHFNEYYTFHRLG